MCVSLCGCVLSSRFQANRSPLTVWSRWSRRNAWKWWPWIPTIKNLVSLCCLHDKFVLKQKHLWILRANELVITPQTVDDSPDPWKMFFKKRTSQFIASVLDLKHQITNEATGRLWFWSKGGTRALVVSVLWWWFWKWKLISEWQLSLWLIRWWMKGILKRWATCVSSPLWP